MSELMTIRLQEIKESMRHGLTCCELRQPELDPRIDDVVNPDTDTAWPANTSITLRAY